MKLSLIFAGIIIIFLAGCSSKKIITDSEIIGGYTIKLEIVPDFDGNNYSDLRKKALSTFKSRINFVSDPEAELARLNRDRGPQPMSQDFKELMTEVLRLCDITEGFCDPYMGKPRELWQFDASEPTTPSASLLYSAVEQAQNTELLLQTGDKAQLTGEGILYLGNVVVGWAIDGAADVLIRGGVDSGKISVGNLARFWGSPTDSAWAFLMNSPTEDSSKFKISPAAGALTMLDLETDGFMHQEKLHYKILNPDNGLPIPEPLSCAAWAPTAAEAAAYVEAIAIMGLTDGFEWVERNENVSAMYFFPANGTYAVTMNNQMTSWVTTVLR